MSDLKSESSRRESTERLLRAAEAAEILAISARTLWALKASGQLPSVKLGGATRFRLSEVMKLVERGVATLDAGQSGEGR